MPRPRKPTTLNDQLALLNDSAPTDFDPEALEAEHSPDDGARSGSDDDSGSEAGDDGIDHAREHYVAVGKSRLRKGPELEALGEAYVGTKVSRGKLYDESESESEEGSDEGEEDDEDEDMEDNEDGEEDGSGISVYSEDSEIPSDDAFGSDDERFEDWKFRGSRTTEGGRPAVNGDKITGSSSDEESDNSDQSGASSDEDQSGSDGELGEEDDDDAESSSDESTSSTRAQLQNLLTNTEKSTTTALESSLTRDQQKGAAIRTQQSAFDSLLRTRIQLQKSLTSSSTLPLPLPTSLDPASASARSAAESAALSLFNSISTLRAPLHNKKRTHDTAFTTSTSTSELWAHLASLDTAATPHRTAVLEKWALKTQPITVEKSRLDKSANTRRNLTSSIASTLSSSATQLLTKSRGGDAAAVEVFDDADFYGQLLRALVDSRMADGAADVGGEIRWAVTQQRERKKRKGVDTKASKGRKMKYTVHEKLVGFMAPMEGYNRWREEQVGELFGSLLGVRRGVLEEEDEEDGEKDVEMSDGDEIMEGGVRLFR